jgi:hypothetical protein
LILLFILVVFFAQFFAEDVPCQVLPSFNFSDLYDTCLASGIENGGRGGWTNFWPENPKNERTSKSCLLFGVSKNFEKSMIKNPPIQDLEIKFDDFEKLDQKDNFLFYTQKSTFPLFLVLSTVKQAGLKFFFSSLNFSTQSKMVMARPAPKFSSKFHDPDKLECVFSHGTSAYLQRKMTF